MREVSMGLFAYLKSQDKADSKQIFSFKVDLWPQGDCSVSWSQLRDTGFFNLYRGKTTNKAVFDFWVYLTQALLGQGFEREVFSMLEANRREASPLLSSYMEADIR